MSPSLTEMSTKVDELTAQVDEKEKEAKKAMEDMKKEHKDAMEDMDNKHKDAMEEKEKDAKTAMEEEKKNHEAKLTAVLKAMEEEDKDKRDAAVKVAVETEHKDDQHTQTSMHKGMEDDEEKKAMKAQLDYQDKIIKKPKLQILEAAYINAGVNKDKVEEYKADWNKMSAEQLDGAIEKAQPIIEMSATQIEVPAPLSLGKGLGEFSASTKSGNEEYSAKVDKMTPEELFAN